MTTNRPDWALIDHADGYAYGITADGAAVEWNVDDGHALFAGAPGTGKTAAAASVAFAALRRGHEVVLVGGRPGELSFLEPHATIARTSDEAMTALRAVQNGMHERRRRWTPDAKFTPIVVIVNELIATFGEGTQPPHGEPTPHWPIIDFLRGGRSTNVRVLVVTTRTTPKDVDAVPDLYDIPTHRTLFGQPAPNEARRVLLKYDQFPPVASGMAHSVRPRWDDEPTPFVYWQGTDDEYAYRLRHRLGRGKQRPVR